MDTVTIAEKVKFWQEQDRINKALIPRLLKTHELVTDLSQQFSKFIPQLAAIEARLTKKGNEEFNLLRNELNQAKSSVKNIETVIAGLMKQAESETGKLRAYQKQTDLSLERLAQTQKQSGVDLDGIKSSVSGLETRLTEMKKLLGEVQSELGGLQKHDSIDNDRQIALQRQLDGIKSSVNDMVMQVISFKKYEESKYVIYFIVGFSFLASCLTLIITLIR